MPVIIKNKILNELVYNDIEIIKYGSIDDLKLFVKNNNFITDPQGPYQNYIVNLINERCMIDNVTIDILTKD